MAEPEAEAKPRRRRAPRPPERQPDTPDPIEIAMAAVATGADRHGAARTVLEKHACLIDIQCDREKEELGVLRVQRLTRWLILAAVLALFLGLGSALWVASRSNSLVIEAFEVPPALGQRGLNGRVVSARVLDQLAELQRSTESMRGEKSYADNWQDDIKLAIPDTGISLGEAWRTLKAWLGHETRIGGEIFQTADGLAISTRAGPLSGGTISGTEGDVDGLIREAARSIYKVTQPYRYAISLPSERRAETLQILTQLTGDTSEMERKWAFSGMAVMYRLDADLPRSLTMARRALAIDPELLPALGNMFHGYYRLGHEEKAAEAVRKFEAAFGHAAQGDYDRRITLANLVSTQGVLATILRDPEASERVAAEMEKLGTTSSFAADAGLARADAAAMRHDHKRAERLIRQLTLSLSAEQALALRYAAGAVALERAADLHDPMPLPDIVAMLQNPGVRQPDSENPQSYRLLRRAELAIAYGRAGMAANARAIVERLPADCYDCVRARGWSAMAAGNPELASRWFREAVRQGPSLAPARVDLGQARLAAGNANEAEVLAREAAERSPRWADPLKLAGDSLIALGRSGEAERAYAEAAVLAPRWGRLHLRWADALWRLGQRQAARGKLAAAAEMDLGPADRIQLARMQAKASRPRQASYR